MTFSNSTAMHATDDDVLRDTQRAVLNILEDFASEKAILQQGQRSVINILEDFEEEKLRLQHSQSAVLNVLEDSNQERVKLEAAERAALNILEDSFEEKAHLQNTQRALLNIMEDINSVETINQRVVEERRRADEISAELRAANKELEAFSYSVSHDLRAPLRHIAGFANLLIEEHVSELSNDGQRYLRLIVDSTRHMGQLVDDFLNLARLGRQELKLQVVGLRTLVEEAIAEFSPDVKERSVSWQIGALPYVECDATLMKIVFSNLISNALKFTGPRELAIIEVGVREVEGQKSVFVKDNGVGFSMKYADKLFGVFQRLHRAEEFHGTGVGLATVQRIIHKHGGRIWAEAELDKGATFLFALKAQ